MLSIKQKYLISIVIVIGIGFILFPLPVHAQNNKPPEAMIVGPSQAFVGQVVIFDSGNSNDPDGAIVRYLWDFGDEDVSTQAVLGDSTVAHVYEAAGTYQVTLTVIDDDDLSDTASHTIVIEALSHRVYLPILIFSAD